MCEALTDEGLAEKKKVTPRWIADRARDPKDPIPHFKLGRVRRYDWNCPDSPLWKRLLDWFDRHSVGRR